MIKMAKQVKNALKKILDKIWMVFGLIFFLVFEGFLAMILFYDYAPFGIFLAVGVVFLMIETVSMFISGFREIDNN